MLKWEKMGRIFSAEGYSDWMTSHVQNPVAILLKDRCRIFFNTRPEPEQGLYKSYPTYVGVDIDNPAKVIEIAKHPVLETGSLGCFDRHGCMCGSVVRHGDALWMYYVGWSRGVDVPYRWAIGLAVSHDEGRSFKRYSEGPVMTANVVEPLQLHNAPHVIKFSEDDWRMWYSAGTKWLVSGDKIESVYIVKNARSKDGIHWERHGDAVVPAKVSNECQTSASIFEHCGKYHMLFSYRHGLDFRNSARGYKIGYAVSRDLNSWERNDSSIELNLSESGWDSEMVCYPYVLTIGDHTYVFYCGNHFGRDGFGVAKLI